MVLGIDCACCKLIVVVFVWVEFNGLSMAV